MSTQQDIYAAGSEKRPHMLNKDNYVPWSSCLLRYAKSKPNETLIYSSIINGPYVRRMIPKPGDLDREVHVAETFLEQTDVNLLKRKIYVTLSHTKKIFENMKRVGKYFFRRDTPLFPTMMVQAQEDMGKGSANPTDPHHTPTIIQPSISQPQNTKQHRKPRRKDTELPQTSVSTSVADEAVNKEMDDSLEGLPLLLLA
nr:ribonuclease H-like domain-containing protein [Tanacetum cinerariifolium]